MSTSGRFAAACLAASVLLCAPASAERLVATIAPTKVSISANYAGGHIVVFGAIADAATPQRRYDAVVTVIGPRQDLIVRRKERVLGIWVNTSSSTFFGVPSYLAVSANRPFDDIATEETRRHHRIGLQHAIFAGQSVNRDDPFQVNLIDARLQEGFYITRTDGVSFVSPTVFRAEIPLPKNAPTGSYKVEVHILADGRPIADAFSSAFEVEKIGLPQFVATSAINYSLMYGLAIMGLALLTGWIASVAFSRNQSVPSS